MTSSDPAANESTSTKQQPQHEPPGIVAGGNNQPSANTQTTAEQPKNYEGVIARWTKIVGLFTGLLFVATGISAYFLWRTDLTLRETLTASTRAWIVPRNVEIEQMEIGKPLKIRITYENVGKEPAISVAEYNQGILEVPEKVNAFILDVRDKWGWCIKQPAVLGANVAYPATPLQSTQFHLTLNLIVDERFTKGETVFALYGCFAYETGGTLHHSAFCRFYGSALIPNAMVGCFTGEHAD